MKKKSINLKHETVSVKVNITPPPNIFDAKVIHTKTGSGLLVETRIINSIEAFTMTRLEGSGCIALTLDGAKALKVLLDEWIERREDWFGLAT